MRGQLELNHRAPCLRSHSQHSEHHNEHYDNEQHHQLQLHSTPARKIAFAKGVIDIAVSLSLLFFPSLFYNGILTSGLYKSTGIPAAPWALDPAGLASLAALIMGCGFAGITAGQSESNDAYRTVAALNRSFALMGFLICCFSPFKYGNSFLLLHSLQNILWFAVLVRYGGFGVMDCLGLSTRGLYVVEERLSREVLRERDVLRQKGKEAGKGLREMREKMRGGNDEGMGGAKDEKTGGIEETMHGTYERRGARIVQ